MSCLYFLVLFFSVYLSAGLGLGLDAVCVYKTSGMRIEHLIPRSKGYICEDTNAVVLHLGTNDINGSVNKVKEDINRLSDKMKEFQNTHFYVAEIPPPPLPEKRTNTMPTFTT